MSTSKSIRVSLVRPGSLNADQVTQMVNIYLAHHYMEREACEKRIRQGFDRMALFICKQQNRIVGFNGMRIRTQRAKGFLRPIKTLYLGQMFVESAYRGMHPIHKACKKALLPVLLTQPWYKVVVWGDALTYKPYLLIAHTAKTYFPHPKQEMPERYLRLRDYLGSSNYGENYVQETGCVRKDRLLIKEDVAPIHPRLRKNELINFYAEQNTHYEQGHGLLVMMDFDWKALSNIVQKIHARTLRKWKLKLAQPTTLQNSLEFVRALI